MATNDVGRRSAGRIRLHVRGLQYKTPLGEDDSTPSFFAAVLIGSFARGLEVPLQAGRANRDTF
ncbi:MAG: hypothetical protein ABSA70_15505 [Terriglobia bacterium]